MQEPTIQTTNSSSSKAENENEINLRLRIRWYFLILIAIWTLATLLLTLVAFFITRNPISLIGLSSLGPPTYMLYRIVKYLFPSDEKEFKITSAKFLHTNESQRNKV